jgi:hypothetical protein
MVSKRSRAMMLAASCLALGGPSSGADSSLRAAESSILVRPAQDPVESRRIAPGSTICVQSFQNMSGRSISMGGIEDQLAARLNDFGYRAGRPGELGSCDATVHTEIVQLTGRARMRAELDFRVVLAGEQAPRLSATVRGKSPKLTRRHPFTKSLVPAGLEKSAAEREAILSALAQQSRRIQVAQHDGMALYAGAAGQPE